MNSPPLLPVPVLTCLLIVLGKPSSFVIYSFTTDEAKVSVQTIQVHRDSARFVLPRSKIRKNISIMASNPSTTSTSLETGRDTSSLNVKPDEKQCEISIVSVRESGQTKSKKTAIVPEGSEMVHASTNVNAKPEACVSVIIKTDKGNTKDGTGELRNISEHQPQEISEFKEEIGGYEDDEEEGFEDDEDENGYVEMDEEGGYEDEDEEGEGEEC